MEVVKAPDNNRVEKLTRLVQAHQKTLMHLSYHRSWKAPLLCSVWKQADTFRHCHWNSL